MPPIPKKPTAPTPLKPSPKVPLKTPSHGRRAVDTTPCLVKRQASCVACGGTGEASNGDACVPCLLRGRSHV
jgi:hypothetical protein